MIFAYTVSTMFCPNKSILYLNVSYLELYYFLKSVSIFFRDCVKSQMYLCAFLRAHSVQFRCVYFLITANDVILQVNGILGVINDLLLKQYQLKELKTIFFFLLICCFILFHCFIMSNNYIYFPSMPFAYRIYHL